MVESKKDNPVATPIWSEYGGEVVFINPDTFLYAQSADNYVFIHQISEDYKLQKTLFRTSLAKLQKQLCTDTYIRCHRSFLINRLQIKSVRKIENRLSIILNGQINAIPVARKRRKEVDIQKKRKVSKWSE